MQAARALRRGKERRAARAFLVEGPHAVAEALRGGHGVRELFVTPACAERESVLVATAAALAVPVVHVDERVATGLGETVTPQGIFAVVDIPDATLGDVLARSPKLVVLLDGVADPGNTGTIIRTADAAGADAVVLSSDAVDPYAGKCVRATAGSLFHLPVVSGVDLRARVNDVRAAGLNVLAAVLDGESLFDLEPTLGEPTAWLFGSEAHGLRPAMLERADRRVSIPMSGRAESLNLAAAAAVCLFASARRLR